uniref:Uncharacterized protein n=1 Tax=Rhizophora mucronata TaxID=61149 RepID=A0A2P2NDW0_RHIMU
MEERHWSCFFVFNMNPMRSPLLAFFQPALSLDF